MHGQNTKKRRLRFFGRLGATVLMVTVATTVLVYGASEGDPFGILLGVTMLLIAAFYFLTN